MKLSRGVLAALAALMVAAPVAVASDDPAVDPGDVTCLSLECSDPGGTVDDPPADGGGDTGTDNPGDGGDSNPGDSGDGGGTETPGDGGGTDTPGEGDGSGSDGDGGEPIDLCTWEPWNCNGGGDPEGPHCRPMANGTKICIPVDPPILPPCKVDPDTGEQYCWTPPDLCLTARFASEEAAIAAGCVEPPCVVALDGTGDCGGPECPDCVTPYPPPCYPAENEKGEVFCGGPLPCFVDDEGNKICAVYDMAPGDRSSESGPGEPEVGVCVIGVASPCNGKPKPKPMPRPGPKLTPKKPGAKKPAPRKPAAKKPAATKPAVKKPATKKPAAKPAPKKPAAKKPAAKKPATKPKPVKQPKPRAPRS